MRFEEGARGTLGFQQWNDHTLSREGDVCMFTQLGEMVVNQPKNVEYSTGFVVFLPKHLNPNDQSIQTIDVGVQPLSCERVPLDKVREDFRDNPDDFADGASRILSLLDSDQQFEQALMTVIKKRF